MNHWSIRCKHCGELYASGNGFLYVPKFFIPFFRCQNCCKLNRLETQEYITMSESQRGGIENTARNRKYIKQSLDRTNNKEYIKFLKNQGFTIYPTNFVDKNNFPEIDFSFYKNKEASESATQSLYNSGVLIPKEFKDPNTNEISQKYKDIIKRNFKAGKIANILSGIFGIIGAIICLISILSATNGGEGYWFLLSVPAGFLSKFLSYIIIYHLIKPKNLLNQKVLHNNISHNKENGNNSQQKLSALKQLYEDGVINEDEYKKKVYQIMKIDD